MSFDPKAPPGLACLLVGNDEDEADELEALFLREGIDSEVARTGLEALSILERRLTTAIVVDSRLPDLDWLDVARRAAEIVRRQTFIVLRANGGDSLTAARGLDAGARAIVLNSASHSNLLEVLSCAAAGGIYVDPGLR